MMTSQNDYSGARLKMRSPVLVTSLFCFLFWLGDGGQLGWFVFIRIRNTKPWNYFHICTVVLWTKIVVDFMLLEQIAAIDKETGNRMRCESP